MEEPGKNFYDHLLRIFVSTDGNRPAMQQANTVGSKTYATDGRALIIIPNDRLEKTYEAHEKVPNYQSVIDQLNSCNELVFKDTDLFKALESFPKDYDTSECELCEGSGTCPHCHKVCDDCEGEGQVEDKSLPMIYTHSKAVIKIGELQFSPFNIGKLEKAVIQLMADTFTMIKHNGSAAMFKVKDIEILLGVPYPDDQKEPTIINLKPARTGT